MAGQVQKIGLEKHPKGNQGRIQYGTAGFRTKYVHTYFISYIQFPKMNVRRLLSYEAKLLFSEGRGIM